jgi:hypothetical protein
MRKKLGFASAVVVLILAPPPDVFAQCIVPANGTLIQTASYSALAADNGKMVVFNCAAPCTYTLASPPPTSVWQVTVVLNGVGPLTISPNGLQINGQSGNLTLGSGNSMVISTDGSSYYTATGCILPPINNLSPGMRLTNNGSTSAWSSPTLDCSQFSGSDMSYKIRACLDALYTLDTRGGVADARNFPGAQTWSANPFTPNNIPTTGTLLLCNSDTINVYQPIVMSNYWSIEACGTSAGAADNHVLLQASPAFFPTTYSTGTVTKGTPGFGEIITGSGTSWTSNMVGCAFVAPGTQPTPANGRYGIIHSVTDATHIVLGWGTGIGSDISPGSAYVIYCPVLVQGDGHVTGFPANFGMWIHGITMDCNQKAGCVGLMNWYGEELTGGDNFNIKGFTNIGFDRESPYAQNSGPYGPGIITVNNSTCDPNTMAYVSRTNVPLRPIHDFTIGTDSCSTTTTTVIDLESPNETVANMIVFGGTDGIVIGDNTIQCAVGCPLGARKPQNVTVSNIFITQHGHNSAVRLSSKVSAPDSVTLRDIFGNGSLTHVIVDENNPSCTPSGAYNIGQYTTNNDGNIQESTATDYPGCAASPRTTAVYYGGTTFTTNAGCSEDTLKGGSMGGSFVVHTASTCTTTITAAPGAKTVSGSTGWSCSAWDVTTSTVGVKEISTDSRTIHLTVTTPTTGDRIVFACGSF